MELTAADGTSDKRSSRRSAFKGVSRSTVGDGWRAVVYQRQSLVELGYFDSEIEAARGVDKANLLFARKYHGPAPELNLPDSRLSDDGHEEECPVCDEGGTLLCCDKCSAAFHLDCLVPPLEDVPAGRWLCARCSLEAGGRAGPQACPFCGTEGVTSAAAMRLHFQRRCKEAKMMGGGGGGGAPEAGAGAGAASKKGGAKKAKKAGVDAEGAVAAAGPKDAAALGGGSGSKSAGVKRPHGGDAAAPSPLSASAKSAGAAAAAAEESEGGEGPDPPPAAPRSHKKRVVPGTTATAAAAPAPAAARQQRGLPGGGPGRKVGKQAQRDDADESYVAAGGSGGVGSAARPRKSRAGRRQSSASPADTDGSSSASGSSSSSSSSDDAPQKRPAASKRKGARLSASAARQRPGADLPPLEQSVAVSTLLLGVGPPGTPGAPGAAAATAAAAAAGTGARGRRKASMALDASTPAAWALAADAAAPPDAAATAATVAAAAGGVGGGMKRRRAESTAAEAPSSSSSSGAPLRRSIGAGLSAALVAYLPDASLFAQDAALADAAAAVTATMVPPPPLPMALPPRALCGACNVVGVQPWPLPAGVTAAAAAAASFTCQVCGSSLDPGASEGPAALAKPGSPASKVPTNSSFPAPPGFPGGLLSRSLSLTLAAASVMTPADAACFAQAVTVSMADAQGSRNTADSSLVSALRRGLAKAAAGRGIQQLGGTSEGTSDANAGTPAGAALLLRAVASAARIVTLQGGSSAPALPALSPRVADAPAWTALALAAACTTAAAAGGGSGGGLGSELPARAAGAQAAASLASRPHEPADEALLRALAALAKGGAVGPSLYAPPPAAAAASPSAAVDAAAGAFAVAEQQFLQPGVALGHPLILRRAFAEAATARMGGYGPGTDAPFVTRLLRSATAGAGGSAQGGGGAAASGGGGDMLSSSAPGSSPSGGGTAGSGGGSSGGGAAAASRRSLPAALDRLAATSRLSLERAASQRGGGSGDGSPPGATATSSASYAACAALSAVEAATVVAQGSIRSGADGRTRGPGAPGGGSSSGKADARGAAVGGGPSASPAGAAGVGSGSRATGGGSGGAQHATSSHQSKQKQQQQQQQQPQQPQQYASPSGLPSASLAAALGDALAALADPFAAPEVAAVAALRLAALCHPGTHAQLAWTQQPPPGGAAEQQQPGGASSAAVLVGSGGAVMLHNDQFRAQLGLLRRQLADRVGHQLQAQGAVGIEPGAAASSAPLPAAIGGATTPAPLLRAPTAPTAAAAAVVAASTAALSPAELSAWAEGTGGLGEALRPQALHGLRRAWVVLEDALASLQQQEQQPLQLSTAASTADAGSVGAASPRTAATAATAAAAGDPSAAPHMRLAPPPPRPLYALHTAASARPPEHRGASAAAAAAPASAPALLPAQCVDVPAAVLARIAAALNPPPRLPIAPSLLATQSTADRTAGGAQPGMSPSPLTAGAGGQSPISSQPAPVDLESGLLDEAPPPLMPGAEGSAAAAAASGSGSADEAVGAAGPAPAAAEPSNGPGGVASSSSSSAMGEASPLSPLRKLATTAGSAKGGGARGGAAVAGGRKGSATQAKGGGRGGRGGGLAAALGSGGLAAGVPGARHALSLALPRDPAALVRLAMPWAPARLQLPEPPRPPPQPALAAAGGMGGGDAAAEGDHGPLDMWSAGGADLHRRGRPALPGVGQSGRTAPTHTPPLLIQGLLLLASQQGEDDALLTPAIAAAAATGTASGTGAAALGSAAAASAAGFPPMGSAPGAASSTLLSRAQSQSSTSSSGGGVGGGGGLARAEADLDALLTAAGVDVSALVPSPPAPSSSCSGSAGVRATAAGNMGRLGSLAGGGGSRDAVAWGYSAESGGVALRPASHGRSAAATAAVVADAASDSLNDSAYLPSAYPALVPPPLPVGVAVVMSDDVEVDATATSHVPPGSGLLLPVPLAADVASPPLTPLSLSLVSGSCDPSAAAQASWDDAMLARAVAATSALAADSLVEGAGSALPLAAFTGPRARSSSMDDGDEAALG